MAPEEPFDGRSLYDRLKEQRDAKDLEFEESRKFKNMIRGLDDEDADHLNEIGSRRILEERQQREEEQKEMTEYRAKVAELQELSAEQKLVQLAAAQSKPKDLSTHSRPSQKSILTSVVKRKPHTEVSSEPPKKRQATEIQQPSALKCLAVLPGIGDYKSSDDSDNSSSDEEIFERTDLAGRQLKKKKDHDE